MNQINDFVTKLRPGSVVLVVGDEEAQKRFAGLNAEILLVALKGDEPDLLREAVSKATGSSWTDLEKAKVHCQFDLVHAPATLPENMRTALAQYAHPGGLLAWGDACETVKACDPLRVNFAKLTPAEQDFLARTVAALPEGSIYVEIGSYKGGSAALAALANPKIRIYGVDIWVQEDNPEIFAPFESWQRHTQYFPNIFPVRVDLNRPEIGLELIADREGVRKEDLKIDYLFIDGDHSLHGVMRDLDIYGKHSARICGHDFHRTGAVERGVFTWFSHGWRKTANEAANRMFKILPGRKILSGLRRAWPGRWPLEPDGIKHHVSAAEHSSIWFTENCSAD